MRQSDIKKVTAMINEAHKLNAKSRKLEQDALNMCTCPKSHSQEMGGNGRAICTICKTITFSVDNA
jgi:hypothetical protein